MSDYIDSLISILETIIQHKELVKEFSNKVRAIFFKAKKFYQIFFINYQNSR